MVKVMSDKILRMCVLEKLIGNIIAKKRQYFTISTHLCFRTPDMDIGQACHLLHHGDPFNQLGPFKLEQLSGQPYITVIHQLMSDGEMEHFKNYAKDKLERSGHSGIGAGITSLKRTSKQTWLDHRIFNVSIGVAMEKFGLAENETRDYLGQHNEWNHYFMARENFIDDDSVASRVSNRMER